MKFHRVRASIILVFLTMLALLPIPVVASVIFTYDELDRLTTAAYDNGLCISYFYDANGNRTAINSITSTPQPPTWGAANWGCFSWTP